MGEVLMLGFEMDIDMVISVDNLIAIYIYIYIYIYFNKEYVIVISVLVLCKNIYITYEN